MTKSTIKRARVLKQEENQLLEIKQKLQDQLRRLQIEELALRSIITSSQSENSQGKKYSPKGL